MTDFSQFFAFDKHPGHLYVIATLLPMLSFLLLLLVAGKRCYYRRFRESGGLGEQIYRLLGGDAPGRGGAYVATAAIALSFVCVLCGFIQFSSDHHHISHLQDEKSQVGDVLTGREKLTEEGREVVARVRDQLEEEAKALSSKKEHAAEVTRLQGEKTELANNLKTGFLSGKGREALTAERNKLEKTIHDREHDMESRWSGEIDWARVAPFKLADPLWATGLRVGFYIDNLSALMFLMVTFVATLIHLFSIGYMGDELQAQVEDHQVHAEHGHFHRRGRFPLFFMYLSLFCFSMLNLILASNLFQIFVSWELVGICSYLLIGFYYERQSASNAANKAFITNRVGDAGFIIGLLILWTYAGTLNFQEIFQRVRSPQRDSHESLVLAGQIVRGEFASQEQRDIEKGRREGKYKLLIAKPGEFVGINTQAVLFPRKQELHGKGHFHGVEPGDEAIVYANPEMKQYGLMPYWLLVVAGLGIFLGCVGKSAQFPLHVWLPDAMEGPTPVSALIHAATMVAAGVYLVGRCFPLFTAEALLVIAYTGGITLFVAATIAVVATDIKKVLAYSTVSQLGYMMLALGVGGWVAGLFHLLTHAFFKALLFLGSGSVIYGCHHVQEMGKMGGLYPKMKITALTMLVGCLTIAGTPFFSGYYSKDAVLATALGYSWVHREHILLFILPLVTAGLTTFYMFRMWFLTFTGEPKDAHVHEHAHESPWTMTVPLILLAILSVTVAWGWPFPKESWLEHQLHHAQPTSVMADFGGVAALNEFWEGGPFKAEELSERYWAHHHHGLAGYLALASAFLGFVFAALIYYHRVLDPSEAAEQFPTVGTFLAHKWYFDELYSAIVVRPALIVAHWCRWFDLNIIDGLLHLVARLTLAVSRFDGLVDRVIVDGLVNLTGTVCWDIGGWLRRWQTGYLRSYVLFLVLAAVGIWVILSLVMLGPAGGQTP